MSELAWASATDLVRMMATKEVSPVEVVRAHLERIDRLEGTLHAFITVCADPALEAARAAEAALMSGRPTGPLHGLPVGLKDLCATRGVRTTGGSRILADHVPEVDATVVTRLTAAGAIVLGKLNMHEFAYGPEGRNEHYGHTRNPWDSAVARIPGGSSSGSGAAVAAGLVPAALGSDTGGSIRIPASLCGISGIKPTYGRVSRAGVLPLSWSMDHVGPMARSAADCALLLGAMAGYDAADPTTSVLPVPDYTAGLGRDVKGVRVGLLRGLFADGLVPELGTALETAARQLQDLGAVVDEVTLPHMALVPAATFAVVAAEALAYHASWMRTRPQDYQRDVRERLFTGAFVSTTSAPSSSARWCGARSMTRSPAATSSSRPPRRWRRRRSARRSQPSPALGWTCAPRSRGSRAPSTSRGTRPARCRAARPRTASRSGCRSSAGRSTR
jgi:aspartyl-tRNA(Asn)/glutamyl-tRNA(Gln) amidotransferase subunit A